MVTTSGVDSKVYLLPGVGRFKAGVGFSGFGRAWSLRLKNGEKFSSVERQLGVEEKDLHTIRVYKVREGVHRLKFISLKDGLNFVGTAKKLGIVDEEDLLSGRDLTFLKNDLAVLGITDKGIHVATLDGALRFLENSRIVDRIKLRNGERRNTKNLLRAVVGRLGQESEVLERLGINEALEANIEDETAKGILLYEYVKNLYLENNMRALPKQKREEIMIEAVEKLNPRSLDEIGDESMSARLVFLFEAAEKLYPNDLDSQEKFVISAAGKLYFNEGMVMLEEFMSRAACNLYPDDVSKRLAFIIRAADGFCPADSNIIGRAILIAGAAREWIPVALSDRAQFVVKAMPDVGKYLQQDFVVEAAKQFSDNHLYQIDFIRLVARIKGWVWVENMGALLNKLFGETVIEAGEEIRDTRNYEDYSSLLVPPQPETGGGRASVRP